MIRTMEIGRPVIVAGVLVALFAGTAGVAGAGAPARPPSPAPLAEITGGSSYRVVDPSETPAADDWHSVGDETSTTAEPGARVEVRGWWAACSVRDAAGALLDQGAGVLTATCEVPPAVSVMS